MGIFNEKKHIAYLRAKEEAWRALRDLPRRKDLLEVSFPDAQYTIVDSRKALEDLVGDGQLIVISGGYFGDEGKGKWGNSLAELVDAVLRDNSGPNTGRTAVKNGKEYVFHGCPSAILEGLPCFIGPNTTNDPISLLEEELLPLKRDGIFYDKLQVGNFNIITPYHRIMDVLGSGINASTGVGMTPVHKSVAAKTCPQLDDLFDTTASLTERIKKDMDNYRGFLHAKGLTRKKVVELLEEARKHNPRVVPDHVLEFAKAHQQGNINTAIEYMVTSYQEKVVANPLFPQRADVPYVVREMLKAGKKILLEGTQAYFLSSKVEQTHRNGTSADTSAAGVIADSGIHPAKYKTVIINIHKNPFSTRVGRGNIPGSFTDQNRFAEEKITKIADFQEACIDFESIHQLYFQSVQDNGILKHTLCHDPTGTYEVGEALAISSSRKFGECGRTTKKPRITGLFDCVLSAQLAAAQGPYTVISCMDRGDDCEKVGLVVGHVVHLPESGDFKKDSQGAFIDSNGIKYRTGTVIGPGDPIPSSSSNVLHYCQPIIKVMEGWKQTPIKGLEPGDELPRSVCDFVATVEHLTGLEIKALGIGPRNEDALYLKRS